MAKKINPRPDRPNLPGRTRGFTLVEVLVSMTILLMMLLIITQVISTAQRTWRRASSRLSQFREARTAFDTITRGLSQATINAYRTYNYGGSKPGVPKNPLDTPLGYTRTAELGFAMGKTSDIFKYGSEKLTPGHAVIFQAPLGYTSTPAYRQLNRLLCVRGYYVLFGDDLGYLPLGLASALQTKSRYRLYEYDPITETNTVYTANDNRTWLQVNKEDAKINSRPVAENILALVMTPVFDSDIAGNGGVVAVGKGTPPGSYAFNSYTATGDKQYRLPSSVQVVMIAMDEESASRLAQQSGTSPPQLFSVGFEAPSGQVNDLKLVREALLKLRVNYRIFSSSVTIPASDN